MHDVIAAEDLMHDVIAAEDLMHDVIAAEERILNFLNTDLGKQSRKS